MAARAHSRTLRLATLVCVFSLALSVPVLAQVVAYPQIPGSQLSSTYSLSVNGVNVPVTYYDSSGNPFDGPPRKTGFAWFAFSGTADVRVTVNQPISTYILSPKRKAPQATVSGNSLTITLTQPGKFILRNVNSLNEDLFIFADPPESNPPVLGSAGVFNIQSYGASSGSGNATPAIQQAIDLAGAYPGGGVAFVPSGVYTVSSSIYLRSNAHLYLAPGAALNIASGGYDAATALLVKDVSNVKVSGRGTIYGQGATWNMHTKDDTNFHIHDILFFNGATTQLRFAGPTNSGVHNVKILARPAGLADGIDIEAALNLTVEDSFIFSSDDVHAIGAGANPWGVARPSDGILFRNNVYHGTNIASFNPWKGVAYIRNVTFDNIDAIKVRLALAIQTMGGTNVENVTVSNTDVEEVTDIPFTFQIIDCSSWGPQNCGAPMGVMGHIENVRFDNVSLGNYGVRNSWFHDLLSIPNAYMDGLHFNNFGSSPPRVGDFGLISYRVEHAGEDFQTQVLLVA